MRLPAELILAGAMLASCAVIPAKHEVRGSAAMAPISRSDDTTRIDRPYTIRDRTYAPGNRQSDEVGLASWYGDEVRGHPTASGEPFDPDAISAAHPTLPLPSYVEVTALDTGQTILVGINDRGPFHSDRIIDLSLGAARQLGVIGSGAPMVRVRRVDPPEDDKRALREGRVVALRGSDPAASLDDVRSRGGWVPRTQPRIPLGAGPFFIQIASFSSPSRANTLADALGAQVTQGAGTWRVRTGPYQTADEAQAALAPLAARGYPGAIITR